ncbi:APC family permease [Arthrobacter cavernae]|uniref:APC family permease n=1 Tax=Arthrobacter cavernae TaxID=2817681 RepID=A0A939KMG0_9MICC|nr:APC family permease [Arthrobacter cavernae]MBO1268243.1 APC family permease [Arthrobacter cavernae]
MSTHNSVAGEHSYQKTLRWWDGFTISLSIPAALFIVIGYAMGSLGAWTAIALAFAVALIACLQNYVYSEMAGMFGEKVGGISMYANQGWRSRTTLAGPVATFGYWFSWSSSLAIYGLQIGTLVQAEWFPTVTWTFSTGLAEIGLPHVIALAVLILGWGLNVLGMRPAMSIMYVTGVLILIPIVVFAVAPFFSGSWSISNLHWNLSASGFPAWQTIIAWMFVMAWSVYGIEAVAAFVPEFRDTVRDSRIALRLAGFFVLAVYVLVPLGVGGLAEQGEIAANPVTFYLQAFDRLIPGSDWLMTICLIAGLMLMMVMTTAAGGRVLHGSALEGLTIRQLGELNKAGVPARAMSLDLLVNVVLIVFVGDALAVIVAGIMGYLICHILSLTGFINLRRDQPDAERPIRLGRQWVYIAGLLAAIDTVILVVGIASTEITGYGGIKEVIIGILVLSLSVVLYFYRQMKQEKQPFTWRHSGVGTNPGPETDVEEAPVPAGESK